MTQDNDSSDQQSTEDDQGIGPINLGTDDPRVIGLRIAGRFTGADMAGFIAQLEQIRSGGQKALVYLELGDSFTWELDVAREKLGHFGTLWNGIERMAYVVDREWMTRLVGVVDVVTPMHIRAFASDEAEAARAWVLSGG